MLERIFARERVRLEEATIVAFGDVLTTIAGAMVDLVGGVLLLSCALTLLLVTTGNFCSSKREGGTERR